MHVAMVATQIMDIAIATRNLTPEVATFNFDISLCIVTTIKQYNLSADFKYRKLWLLSAHGY